MDKAKEIFADKKTTVWSLIALVTAVVVISQVIIPQVQAFQKTQEELKQLQGRSEKLQTKLDLLNSLDEESGKKQVKVLMTLLPASEEAPIAMITAQELVTKSGLNLKSAGYSKGSKQDDNSIRVGIFATGDISQVKDFLSKLNESPRLLQISSIQLQSRKSSSGSRDANEMEAGIPLTAYYEPLPKTEISIDKPLPQLTAEDKEILEKLTTIVDQIPLAGEENASVSAVQIGKSNPFH